MMTQINLDELITRIHSEVTVGEKLLELGRQKKRAVVSNKTEELLRLNKEENETLHELEELGLERQEWILHFCKDNHLRVTERLKDLIHLIQSETDLPNGKELTEQLQTERDKLIEIYGLIAETTQLNGELLSQSINFTKQMFQRFSHVDKRSKNSNYAPNQQTHKTGLSYSTPSFNHKG
jgi:hypothetical protein